MHRATGREIHVYTSRGEAVDFAGSELLNCEDIGLVPRQAHNLLRLGLSVAQVC